MHVYIYMAHVHAMLCVYVYDIIYYRIELLRYGYHIIYYVYTTHIHVITQKRKIMFEVFIL